MKGYYSMEKIYDFHIHQRGDDVPPSVLIQQMEAAGVGGTAPITIPVYIGEEKIDTIILNAQSRYNLMSGGR